MTKQKYIITYEYKPVNNSIQGLGYITSTTNSSYKLLESLQEVEDFINDNDLKAVRVYEIASEYRLSNQKVKLEKR